MSKAPAKASDPNDLERRVLDPNIAKSEAEWWAKSRIEELERTWLSPEAYETLMRERQEILHELNEPVRLSEWQQLVQERDALQAKIAELVAALEWVRKVTLDIEMHDVIDFALAKVRKP